MQMREKKIFFYLWPPGRTLEAILPARLVPATATLLALSRSFSRPNFSKWLPLPNESEASPIEGLPPRWLATSIDAASTIIRIIVFFSLSLSSFNLSFKINLNYIFTTTIANTQRTHKLIFVIEIKSYTCTIRRNTTTSTSTKRNGDYTVNVK